MKSAVDAPDWSTIPMPLTMELRGTLSVLGWHRYCFPVPTADLLICPRCAVGLSFTHTLEPVGRESKIRMAGT